MEMPNLIVGTAQNVADVSGTCDLTLVVKPSSDQCYYLPLDSMQNQEIITMPPSNMVSNASVIRLPDTQDQGRRAYC